MNRVANFFKETQAELTKMSWPDRQEILGSTWVVITATAIMAVFVSLCDLVLSQVMRFLLRA